MDEFGKSLNNSKNDNSKTKFLHTKANKINVLLFSIIKEEIIKRRRTINIIYYYIDYVYINLYSFLK